MDLKVNAFWDTYLATLPGTADKPGSFQAWSFGSSAEDANELVALVLSGLKLQRPH